MTLALVNQAKARTRSVQLDGGVLQSIAPNSASLKGEPHPQPGKRMSSLGIGLENSAALSLDALCPIRRYRSMLEVEDPPTIQAVEPLTYDELYPSKLNIEAARTWKRNVASPDSSYQDQSVDTEQFEEDSQIGSC